MSKRYGKKVLPAARPPLPEFRRPADASNQGCEPCAESLPNPRFGLPSPREMPHGATGTLFKKLLFRAVCRAEIALASAEHDVTDVLDKTDFSG